MRRVLKTGRKRGKRGRMRGMRVAYAGTGALRPVSAAERPPNVIRRSWGLLAAESRLRTAWPAPLPAALAGDRPHDPPRVDDSGHDVQRNSMDIDRPPVHAANRIVRVDPAGDRLDGRPARSRFAVSRRCSVAGSCLGNLVRNAHVGPLLRMPDSCHAMSALAAVCLSGSYRDRRGCPSHGPGRHACAQAGCVDGRSG